MLSLLLIQRIIITVFLFRLMVGKLLWEQLKQDTFLRKLQEDLQVLLLDYMRMVQTAVTMQNLQILIVDIFK